MCVVGHDGIYSASLETLELVDVREFLSDDKFGLVVASLSNTFGGVLLVGVDENDG